MGGNALRNTTTRRYSRDEYFAAADKVATKLATLHQVRSIHVIEAYRTKESFGDLDILYTTWNNGQLDAPTLQACFEPNELVRNTNVISLNVDELQVDFIHSPDYEFDYAQHYFSFNDLGNLIGKLAHRFGLKHGHDGLWMPIRDVNNIVGTILLTSDHNETLRFLGLDPMRYALGFDTLQEIFDFVVTSPYFNPDDYKLENLNAIARIRDKKRTTYNKFLEYCSNLPHKEQWNNVKEKDKSVHFPVIFEAFPEARDEFQQIMAKIAINRMVKVKFDGELVQYLTGLQHKELGQFMKTLKYDFWFSDEMIICLDQETIKENIRNKFKIYQKDVV